MSESRSAPTLATITVGLVDDHHLVREGLRLVLDAHEGIDVVGEASSQAEAFELLERVVPDVLVLDMTFPDGDGLPLLHELAARHPEMRIVILTMHRDAETVRQAMAAGAAGYVVKGARSSELVQAIEAVHRHERYLHSSVTEAVVEASIAWMREGSPLTVREREILSLFGSGLSIKDISHVTGISQFTVRNHLAKVSEKVGLKGSQALVRYAIEHGLVRRA
jgi:DNA-binding NarL/FixJ family response regulator